MVTKKHADLDHFETLFAGSDDPWGTRHRHGEAVKRAAILHLLPSYRVGRLLELGCGNGSNSMALARRCLTLDACDGSHSAVRLTRRALASYQHAKVHHLVLPGRFPGRSYDAVVVSELFYYLSNRSLEDVVAEIGRTLCTGGTLVLCHHHRQFADASQRQDTLHHRVLKMEPGRYITVRRVRTGKWEIVSVTKL